MIRILVDGDAPDIELCIRTALGERPEPETWIVSAVRLVSGWVVTFPVSPGDRLIEFSWCGSSYRVREAVRAALCGAGYVLPEPRPRLARPSRGAA